MGEITISLSAVLYICGAIATIIATVQAVKAALTKSINNTTKEAIKSSMDECSSTLHKEIKTLSDNLNEFTSKQDKIDKNLRENMVANARVTINQIHYRSMKEGFIATHTMMALEDVYKNYKDLGGNSFIDKEMNELRELPSSIEE